MWAAYFGIRTLSFTLCRPNVLGQPWRRGAVEQPAVDHDGQAGTASVLSVFFVSLPYGSPAVVQNTGGGQSAGTRPEKSAIEDTAKDHKRKRPKLNEDTLLR